MEKERLKYSMSRFDHYYDSVNNKSAIVLGLSTFIVGALVASCPMLYKYVEVLWSISILYYSCIGLGLSAMLVMIIASIPFLKEDGSSVLFFLSIAKTEYVEFASTSAKLTEDEELDDLRKQNYILARGLTGKFKKLKIACLMITLQFIIFIPLIILIINNLKK